ncbi:unnamed protein product [Spirodela intermedia]|uniref:Uncharacterized protein n=1 Tax=Spirodela intermedia TaxID=51605 RepID=A0A7I8KDI4_SPIIN|nr:unnamed protein product [Spirodela intermedia]
MASVALIVFNGRNRNTRSERTNPKHGHHVVLLELLVPVEPDKHVDEVCTVAMLSSRISGDPVLCYDTANQSPDVGNKLGAASGDTVGVVECSEPGEMVGPVEGPEKLEALPHHAFDLRRLWITLRPVVVAPSEDAAHDVVQRGHLQVAAEGDLPARRLLRRDGLEHGAAVGLPARLVCGDAARGEEVGGSDAAEEAPVGAAGSETHGTAEHELAGGAFERAVGEMWVGEHLAGDGGVGGNYSGGGADGEGH